jgi:hypothetical protein
MVHLTVAIWDYDICDRLRERPIDRVSLPFRGEIWDCLSAVHHLGHTATSIQTMVRYADKAMYAIAAKTIVIKDLSFFQDC